MNIVIRVDSSTMRGSGHLMRCLTLADILRSNGHYISFICRDLPGSLHHIAIKKGYRVFITAIEPIDSLAGILGQWQQDALTVVSLQKEIGDIGCIIVDHYNLDYRWEQMIRPYVSKIMVIDDLADRIHDCEFLLDQNLHKNMETRYLNFVPDRCVKFLGPQYALLRKDFIDMRRKLRQRGCSVKRILVFFGAGDSTNETSKTINALKMLNHHDFIVDVIVGEANPYKAEIQRKCAELEHANYYCQIENMAEFINKADIAVGAGGTSTWERCFLGLPSITVVIAENQLEITEAVVAVGAIWNLGWHYNLDSQHIADSVYRAINTPERLAEMSAKALDLMGIDTDERYKRLLDAITGGNV